MAGGDLRGDRLASAALQAVAVRHVVGNGDQAATCDALCAALDSDVPSGPEVDAALAELGPRVTPQVLVMAAAVFLDDPMRRRELRLLVLLGADVDAARRWREAHPGGGWTTPQADRWDA